MYSAQSILADELNLDLIITSWSVVWQLTSRAISLLYNCCVVLTVRTSEHRMREHASVTVCVCFYLCFLQVSADVTEAEANYQTPNGWYLVHYAAYLGVSLPALYCRQMCGSGSV